jgi:DnaJ-class molecular chaperone
MTATCKVCAGSGKAEGSKCIFCGGKGYYQIENEKVEYHDPLCGEITEFDA